MGDTYYEEEAYESAYILYLKYLTLFIEKIRAHPEYKLVAAAEKARVMKTAKAVMPKSERIKAILNDRFEQEYDAYLVEVELRNQEEAFRAEEERQAKLRLDGENLRKEINRYHDEKDRAVQMQRDLDVALYHQLRFDKENEESESQPPSRPATAPAPSAPPAEDGGSRPYSVVGGQTPAVPDRSTKPSTLSVNCSGSGSGLRIINVPSMVMGKFMSLAQSNTKANIETCGILAGRLSQNRFSVTHLLIPKQSGTADSCTTEGEEAIFDYQDKHDLITLGWIHTHPSQTAFLSSVDLHTHLSYQLMLPEAIAIVISPKYNETGFFVLTPNYGLDYIAKCREPGFHPHPKEPPLFEEGGHVNIDENANVELVDLRK